MGSDKAFLVHEGRKFVQIISAEMLKISNEVMVVIGNKDRKAFEAVIDPHVKIINDEFEIRNPMGGMLSAIPRLSHPYVAFLACDTPLVKSSVIRFLYEKAVGHSAAIPIWNDKKKGLEPLCAVYNTRETEKAGLEALRKNKIGCKNLISFLSDVEYVDVERLKELDPKLVSLINVNFMDDLKLLE